MEYGRIFVLLMLVVFLFGITSVCASEMDTPLASEDTGQILLSANEKVIEENPALTLMDNDETVGAQTGMDLLGADSATYSDLADEINQSGNIKLTHKNYTYNDGATAITISEANKVIDGDGAVIDMKGSTIRALTVSASGVIIKNLTIKNAKINGLGGAICFTQSTQSDTVMNCNFTNNSGGTGGAILFEISTTCTVKNCNFNNNKASGGGAVFSFGTGTVTDCNFVDNNATSGDGGAVYLYNPGTVKNCNFTNNSARYGGAVCFMNNNGGITNCNFNNNKATFGGAIFVYGSSTTVKNCNFVDNKATSNDGGAICFRFLDGTVKNCDFTNNSARNGGAIYFHTDGTVTKCNFMGNNATTGSAIYFNGNKGSKLVMNSCFLNNRANAETLEVTKNDNNITVTFTGNDNLLNAIYSNGDVSFTNVVYWSADGIVNTDSYIPSRSNKEAGQNITVGVIVNGEILLNDVYVTDENGTIVLDINAGENYYIRACHYADSYYTGIERAIPNMTFNVNVTSQTSNNSTVNITAKSNILGEVMAGKLLFILPNGTEINATYATNGTWWALYTFDNAGDYNVNASYIGLDGVIINNATISIRYDASVDVKNKTLDLLIDDTFTIVATTTPEGLNVSYVADDSGVYSIDENGNVTALKEGKGSILVKVGGDGIFVENSTIVNVTVSKIPTEISVDSTSLELFIDGETVIIATLTPAGAGNLTYSSSNESVVTVGADGMITAVGEGNAIITVSFTGNDRYAAAENQTIFVSVSLKNVDWMYGSMQYLDGAEITVPWNGPFPETYVEDEFGEVLPMGQAITIQFNDTVIDSVVYDDYGFFDVDVSGLSPGTYTVTFSADGYTSAVATVTIETIPTEISVANATVALEATDEVAVGATLTPADAGNLTYTSSNESVVKVEDGKIIAVGEGNATITVSFAGDDTYAAADNKTIGVSVTLKDATVSVENDTLELLVGEDGAIVAITTPEGINVTYTPDDSGVVSVDENGIVTALKEGTASIIVKVGGDGVYTEDSTTVTITVSKVPTEISVANATFDLLVGDEVASGATLTPVDAGNVTYTSSNESVVKVEDGNIIAVGEGTATITVSFAGDDKYVAAEDKTIDVTVSKVPTEISVDPVSLDLLVGNESAIVATLTPADAGNVTFTSSDESVVKVDAKGNVIAVGEGTATITVSFAGDDKYVAAEDKTIDVTVSKVVAEISIDAPAIEEGENATVTVTLPEDATGTVTVGNETVPVVDGTATVTIADLPVGNTTLPITYSGDDKYNPIEDSVTITVDEKPVPTKENLTISAAVDPITVGEDAVIVVSGLENATGNVTAEVGDGIYTAPIVDGVATITVPGLVENATVTITYPGDDNYNNASTTVDIVVNPKAKENATYSIDAPEVTEGENATVTVTLPEDATGTVTVGNETVPVVNGTASVTIADLPAGNTTLPVTYSGDDKYNPIEDSVTIAVEEDKSDIVSAPDVVKYYKGPERFVVTVTDYEGAPLANKTVIININGRDYTRTTDANGTASMAIGLPSSTYNVTVTVDNQTVNSVVTILSTVNGTDVVKMYRNGTQYYATFLDSEGNYLKDGTVVKFNINGVMYERKVSGDKGLAKLNINLPEGEYIITAINPETSEMAANNITVLSSITENRDITKYYKNGTQYTVKVLGADGKAVGAGETVKFNINGVFYERKTNESGIAKLSINLPEGDYVITAEYNGCKVANNITVLPVLSAKDITMKYRDGTKFVATLLDGQGKPYAGQTVQFNINGVMYNRATDANGQAKLNINLMAGQYIITSSYNGANIANKITITA